MNRKERRAAAKLGGVADIIEPVLAFLEAETGGELRPQLQLFGELCVEEGSKPGVFGIGARRGGRRLRRNRDRG